MPSDRNCSLGSWAELCWSFRWQSYRAKSITNQQTEQQKQQPKNFQTASIIDGGQQQNVEIISVISFIEQSMKTLKSFGEQLKIQLDTNLTQQGMSLI